MDNVLKPTALMALARFVGIFAPTLYCGFATFDSLICIQSIITHAPDQKAMGKLWYHCYYRGPMWVPPQVLTGTISNLYLACLCRNSSIQRSLYLAAAAGIFSVLPITFGYMEPGINGAGKWKVQTLLKEEGFRLPETSIWAPSSRKQSATPAWRRWAEKSDMKDIVRFWQTMNNVRWVVVGTAAMLSGWATFGT